MLRGRYDWLSQRNQFILPSPHTSPEHHPSSVLLRSRLPPRHKAVDGKKRVHPGKRIHTYIHSQVHTIQGNLRRYTRTFMRKRRTGLCGVRDRAERLIWFNGEFIWVDSPPFNQQDCLTDRLPTRPRTTTMCRPVFSVSPP